MSIRLGRKILYRNGCKATVIAMSGCNSLLGWKENEEILSFAWSLKGEFASLISHFEYTHCTYVDNIRDYHYAYWALHENLIEINGSFSKVNQKTLRKRIRDQIAQEIYKE